MDSKKSIFSYFKAKPMSAITLVLLILVIALSGVLFVKCSFDNDEATISASYISGKLEEASELTTAKLTYTGVADYTDEGIPVISQGDFTMVYNANVRAGIDIKKVKTNINNQTRTVKITIPDAEILDVKVDPKSIRYYDEAFALFNTDEKEDANRAQTMAEKDAIEHVAECGILELADQQAETLIKGILEGCVNNYDIKFTRE